MYNSEYIPNISLAGKMHIIWTIGYLYVSHRLIPKFYDGLRPVLMDRPRFAFRRLDTALSLLGLLCLLWLINDIFCFAVAFILL
jgi:putative ABC transport system permease protein